MLTPKQYRHLTELVGSAASPEYKPYLDAAMAGQVFAFTRLFQISPSGYVEIPTRRFQHHEEIAQAIGIAMCIRAELPASNRAQTWLRRIAGRQDVRKELERLL